MVPVIVADISRDKTVAGWSSLSGLSDAGPMIITEEDRWRRRRRQLRALKATLKVAGQERLYRVCLRRAWKTERETRSRDQSTTSSRFYNIPLSPYIRILTLRLFPLISRLDFSPSISLSSFIPFFSLIVSFLSFFCDVTALAFLFREVGDKRARGSIRGLLPRRGDPPSCVMYEMRRVSILMQV